MDLKGNIPSEKSDSDGFKLYDSIDLTLLKLHYSDREKISRCQSLGLDEGITIKQQE